MLHCVFLKPVSKDSLSIDGSLLVNLEGGFVEVILFKTK